MTRRLLTLSLLAGVALTGCGPSLDVPETARQMADTLNRELTAERRQAVTSNDEGAALVEEIIGDVARRGPDGLQVSVFPELGGLLIDIAAGDQARCIFVTGESLVDDDPALVYDVDPSGCAPEAYVSDLQTLAVSLSPLPGPQLPDATTPDVPTPG